jgi:hypothetical protein
MVKYLQSILKISLLSFVLFLFCFLVDLVTRTVCVTQTITVEYELNNLRYQLVTVIEEIGKLVCIISNIIIIIFLFWINVNEF